jgi:hypothetical protein
MSNKWRRVGKRDKFKLNMELDHSWVVQKDGAKWFVYRDGIAQIDTWYMDAQKAMEAAEKSAGVVG